MRTQGKALGLSWRLAALALAAPLALGSLPTASAEESEAPPLTLERCYQLALKRSEEIALRAELIAEAEARFLQSRSALLPKLFFTSTDKRQDSVTGGISAFTRRSQPERKFTLAQPLFAGFKEFAALSGAKVERQQRAHEKARAEHLLLVDVSDAFHLLLEQREELRILNAIRQILLDRLQELQARQRIGRSRLSELAAVRAQLYRVEAEWESVQAQETLASHLLQFLTGLDVVGELADPAPSLPIPEGIESYLAKAETRPDVKAAEDAVETARQGVRAARAAFYPEVGAEGNYFVERSGPAEQIKWDAALKVNVPLFKGGENVGALRQAQSRLRQAEIQLQRIRRTAAQQIRDGLADYEGARARVRALTLALEATEESYQLQVEEYRRNLVSNLEVLSALEDLQQARRQLVQARFEALRLWWRLKAAVGEVPAAQEGTTVGGTPVP